jgi:hypothetical protein
MDDVTTPDGILAYCAKLRAAMAALFLLTGRFESPNGFSFTAHVFATHDFDGGMTTGKKLDQIEVLPCSLPKWMQDFPRQAHTEIFGQALRAYARLARATGVVFIGETWTLTLPEGKGREDFPGDLEEAPGRRECLFMQLEHIDLGRKHWMAEIRREPTSLDEWLEEPVDETHGRLVDLVDWSQKP